LKFIGAILLLPIAMCWVAGLAATFGMLLLATAAWSLIADEIPEWIRRQRREGA
jgi:hypothetical protein